MSHRKNVLAKLDAIHETVQGASENNRMVMELLGALKMPLTSEWSWNSALGRVRELVEESSQDHLLAIQTHDDVVSALRMEPGLIWSIYLAKIRQLVGPEPTEADEALKEQIFAVKLDLLGALQMSSDEASFELRTLLDEATVEVAKARLEASNAFINKTEATEYRYDEASRRVAITTNQLLRMATAVTGADLRKYMLTPSPKKS